MIPLGLILLALAGGATGTRTPEPVPTVVEARALLARAHPRAFRARVAAARALLATGAEREAVDELDRILRVEPDEEHVLALLPEALPHVALSHARAPAETERDAWLREGARQFAQGGSPLRRERIVSELESLPRAGAAGRETGVDALFDDLARGLEDGVDTRRAFAALALRRLYAGRNLGPLAVRAVLDPAFEVREEATLALRAAHDARACGAVVQALSSRNPLVRARAADALGRMGYREGVPPLVQMMLAAAPSASGGGGPVRANFYEGLSTAYVQDYDLEIAQGASVANPIVQVLTSGVVFDVGVGGTSSQPVTTDVWSAATALSRLTGARHGADAGRWREWWAQHRDEYLPPARPAHATGN